MGLEFVKKIRRQERRGVQCQGVPPGGPLGGAEIQVRSPSGLLWCFPFRGTGFRLQRVYEIYPIQELSLVHSGRVIIQNQQQYFGG